MNVNVIKYKCTSCDSLTYIANDEDLETPSLLHVAECNFAAEETERRRQFLDMSLNCAHLNMPCNLFNMIQAYENGKVTLGVRSNGRFDGGFDSKKFHCYKCHIHVGWLIMSSYEPRVKYLEGRFLVFTKCVEKVTVDWRIW